MAAPPTRTQEVAGKSGDGGGGDGGGGGSADGGGGARTLNAKGSFFYFRSVEKVKQGLLW